MISEEEYRVFVRGNLSKKMDQVGMALGLCGEAGEVAELFKKEHYHDVPFERSKALKEFGDVLFYLTGLADELGFTMEEVRDANHAKLLARYPGGFTPGGGLRDDKQAVPALPEPPSPSNYISDHDNGDEEIEADEWMGPKVPVWWGNGRFA